MSMENDTLSQQEVDNGEGWVDIAINEITPALPEMNSTSETSPFPSGYSARNFAIGLSGIVINSLTFLLVATNPKLGTGIKLLILNLILNDAIFMTSSCVYGTKKSSHTTDGDGCWEVVFLLLCPLMMSYILIFQIAVVNFIAIYKPLHFHSANKTKVISICIIVGWIYSMGLCIPCVGFDFPENQPCMPLVAVSRSGILGIGTTMLFCFGGVLSLNIFSIRLIRRQQRMKRRICILPPNQNASLTIHSLDVSSMPQCSKISHLTPRDTIHSSKGSIIPQCSKISHLIPRDTMHSWDVVSSPQSPKISHLTSRDTMHSRDVESSPQSPKISHLIPRDTMHSRDGESIPQSPKISHLTSRDAIHSPDWSSKPQSPKISHLLAPRDPINSLDGASIPKSPKISPLAQRDTMYSPDGSIIPQSLKISPLTPRDTMHSLDGASIPQGLKTSHLTPRDAVVRNDPPSENHGRASNLSTFTQSVPAVSDRLTATTENADDDLTSSVVRSKLYVGRNIESETRTNYTNPVMEYPRYRSKGMPSSDGEANASQNDNETLPRRSTSLLSKVEFILIILTSWSCLLSLPFIVYMIWVAAFVQERGDFATNSIGVACSSLILINSLSNPFFYAWRFIDWKYSYMKIKKVCSI